MFELSEAELQVLEELWKLIQSNRTLQEVPSREARSEILRGASQPPGALTTQEEGQYKTPDSRHISLIYPFKRRSP
jgi:hypothetical protein